MLHFLYCEIGQYLDLFSRDQLALFVMMQTLDVWLSCVILNWLGSGFKLYFKMCVCFICSLHHVSIF
jgi:hypothetical protein